jgi:hypothetical protein
VTYGHHWYTALRFCLCIHLPAASEVAESEAKELTGDETKCRQKAAKKTNEGRETNTKLEKNANKQKRDGLRGELVCPGPSVHSPAKESVPPSKTIFRFIR